MENKRTIKQHRKNIQDFANVNKIVFEDKGEIGFFCPCVGLIRGDCYVAFNPTSYPSHKHIDEFYDKRLFDIVPKDAYHKGDFIAVLGYGEKSIIQLSKWVDELKKLKAKIVDYETGATGMQALLTGLIGQTIIIPK